MTEGARERILAAAVERIAEEGIDEVRIARVAMDAGVSTSLVHYHFETREALLAEALEYSYEQAGDVRIGEGEGGLAEHGRPAPARTPARSSATGSCGSSCGCAPSATRSCAPPPRGCTTACATWLAEGMADQADAERAADRLMALADGYGVRVLIGAMDIEDARQGDLGGLDRARSPSLGSLNRRSGKRRG